MTDAITVKERPILMSAPMVRAILEGRKTQTRRVVKPQPERVGNDCWTFRDDVFSSSSEMEDHLFHEVYGGCDSAMPYGGVYEGYGDRLWVRETWRANCDGELSIDVNYRADDTVRTFYTDSLPDSCIRPSLLDWRWKPSIFMPRWACRLLLELTDVRVERLQDTSHDDAYAEGIEATKWATTPLDLREQRLSLAQLAYSHLWDEINGKGSWESNPWVWALSFRRIDQ